MPMGLAIRDDQLGMASSRMCGDSYCLSLLAACKSCFCRAENCSSWNDIDSSFKNYNQMLKIQAFLVL
uniref:Uncharacterized protein n=1 Tax=Populus trichocarpa TaxID=3694 RepID=U7DVL7_POPTR